MLKVFLAEDETLIREGLRDNIPWEQYGYRFVGEAADGEMALPLIRKTKPDVLITDIKMPFMDGLSLSRIVREELPKTKIIIISGYDDFEYAREAIAIGVDQYLLKPVTRMNLRKVLQELKEKIEQDVEQEDYQTMLQNEMHEYEQFSRRLFFEKVLEGKMSVKEIYDEAAKLEMELTASSYNLIFISLQEHRRNQTEREVEQFLRQQEEILHYFLRYPKFQVFRWNVNCYGVLIKSDQDNVEKETDQALDYVQKICEKAPEKMDWYVAAGKPVERLSMLKECYKSASHCLAYRFVLPQMHVLTEENLSRYMENQEENSQAAVTVDTSKVAPDVILDFLARGIQGKIYNFVESYLGGISEAMKSRMFCEYVVLNIRFTILSYVESVGGSKEEYLQAIGEYAQNIHMESEEVFEYFVKMLQIAIEIRDKDSDSQGGSTLRRALEYIQDHYTEESLTLGNVACEVKVNANYLSSIFSQSMEKTFTEYVTEKRMEKARKLLRDTTVSTAEIAATVGYKDSHYFSFVFKKTQGVSPRDYRNGKKN